MNDKQQRVLPDFNFSFSFTRPSVSAIFDVRTSAPRERLLAWQHVTTHCRVGGALPAAFVLIGTNPIIISVAVQVPTVGTGVVAPISANMLAPPNMHNEGLLAMATWLRDQVKLVYLHELDEQFIVVDRAAETRPFDPHAHHTHTAEFTK